MAAPLLDPVQARFLRTPPPRAALAALVARLSPGGRVVRVRRLRGGIDAAVHRVDVETKSGGRASFVVRRFDPERGWWTAARTLREAAVLEALAPSAVPAPEVVLVDVDATVLDRPAMVLALLPGRILAPSPDARWAARLAEALAAVHEQPTDVAAEAWLRDWAEAEPPADLAGVAGGDRIWAGVEASRAALLREPTGLAHHDFHPQNTLWRAGRLTGVVDWTLAGRGPAGYDVAYCEVDITLSTGPEAALAFRRAHEATTGGAVHPAWRLVAASRALPDVPSWVASYVDAGFDVGVGVGPARARLRRLVAGALAELGA